MKNTRIIGAKRYTIVITAFLLLFVILTGCDLTGTGGVTPEVLSAEDIVPEAPGEGSGGYETPGEGAGGTETPGEGSGGTETPGEGAGGTETPGEGTGGTETPGEGTGGTETPGEGSGGSEAPGEGSGGYETPGEGTGGTETPSEGSGGSETLSTDPANPTTWNAQQVYATAGYYVSHNGKTYENQWWVQGDEPGETNAWREVNADGSYVVYLQPGQENISDWSETVEYPGTNYYVRYNGLEYRSRWHANAGEVPGTAAVWETVE